MFKDLLQYSEVGGALQLICKRPEIAINLHSGHKVHLATRPSAYFTPLPNYPYSPQPPFPKPKLPPYSQCEFHTQSNQATIDRVNLCTATDWMLLFVDFLWCCTEAQKVASKAGWLSGCWCRGSFWNGASKGRFRGGAIGPFSWITKTWQFDKTCQVKGWFWGVCCSGFNRLFLKEKCRHILYIYGPPQRRFNIRVWICLLKNFIIGFVDVRHLNCCQPF